jgi:hypothetical protein
MAGPPFHPDVAAPWFRARGPLGIDDTMYFAVIDPVSGQVRWERIPHREADGIGGFLRLFRRWGVTRFAAPPERAQPVPGLWQSWRAARRAPQPAAPSAQWHPGGVGVALDRPPISVCWFSRAQTRALTEQAQARKVSLATLVFWALHETVMARLVLSGGGSWFYPVSLRGALRLPSEEHNHAGGFYVTLPRHLSAEALQQCLRESLRAGRHWWLWHQARLVSRLGQAMVNRIYRRLVSRHCHLGSFSVLGEWWLGTRGTLLPPQALLCACGPGSPNHPVANGMMVTNGRLALALRLDPVLGLDDAAREACLAHWRDTLLAQCPPPVARHTRPQAQGEAQGVTHSG